MNASPLYPIFLDLHGQPVLVVGAGAVALRKVRGLLESGAKVTVVSPRFNPSFADLSHIHAITAAYDSALMAQSHWRLVFAATHDPAVNARISEDAAVANILCHRSDELEHSDFASPAIARLGQTTLAVSTQGASPTLARRIRDAAAQAIDPVLISLAELSARWREEVKRTVPDINIRTALLQNLAGPEMEQTLRSHGPAAAEALFGRWLAQPARSPAAVDDE